MHPIVAALKHHKTTVALVAIEVALACAIITNALSLIGDSLAAMRVSTGVADTQLVWASTNYLDLGQTNGTKSGAGLVAADMAVLRDIPGVESVAETDGLPLGGGYISLDVYRQPGDMHSALDNVVEYLGTPGTLKTLGIHLTEGRDFLPQEYVDYDPFGSKPSPSAAIVTHVFAAQMWPGKEPLGKPVYLDDTGKKVAYVVGVVGHLLNPSINKYQGAERNLILPVKAVAANPIYVLRVASEQREAVKRELPEALTRVDAARTVEAHIYSDTVASYFHGDRAMVWLLVVVIGCLLAVTALGIVGLSSFWVQQRTRQIGIRRALGATRADILQYFLAENFLIVGIGVVVGLLGAVGLNVWLMDHYELHRMPLVWLPAGALMLWLLGQLAVLAPAFRASNVPPVVATRTV
jgi:putative ABC transport system permease protein